MEATGFVLESNIYWKENTSCPNCCGKVMFENLWKNTYVCLSALLLMKYVLNYLQMLIYTVFLLYRINLNYFHCQKCMELEFHASFQIVKSREFTHFNFVQWDIFSHSAAESISSYMLHKLVCQRRSWSLANQYGSVVCWWTNKQPSPWT